MAHSYYWIAEGAEPQPPQPPPQPQPQPQLVAAHPLYAGGGHAMRRRIASGAYAGPQLSMPQYHVHGTAPGGGRGCDDDGGVSHTPRSHIY